MGLLNIIQEKIENDEVNSDITSENKQMRKKTANLKKTLEEVTNERDSYRDKYIALLEEKGEGFSQYLYWQNKANEAEADEKEIRKELSDLKSDYKKDMKDFEDLIRKIINKDNITSLVKCENFDDFIAYTLKLYLTEKDLPLKGIKGACKKLGITKNMIKDESEYLYKVLNVDKWEIEERGEK